jgi:acetyl esterase/lipase
MTMRHLILCCLALATIHSAAAQPAAQPAVQAAGSVAIEPDIVYGTGGGLKLKLDLARPISPELAGPQGAPCVVVIHGGAWRMGDKSNHRDEIRRFADNGFVSATIQYRFAPGYQFPAQVEDVKCAIRFLRAHASDYGIDPNRIGAVGFSAGAHLSMMLATLDSETYAGQGGWADQSSKVQAAVSFYGPTLFTADNMPEQTEPLVADFLGGSLADQADAYRDASPLTHVSSDDPPMLLFQGTNDELVPYTQAFEMATAMTRHDVPGRVELLIGAGHGWGGSQRQRTTDETLEFFIRHLAPR